MVRTIIFMIGGILLFTNLQAQSLTITVNADTISMDQVLEVSYKVDESCRADNFEFENFDIVYGPNISRSMSYVNGEMSAETSVTFGLIALEVGQLFLPNQLCGIISEWQPSVIVIEGYEKRQTKDERIKSKRKIKKI